MAESFLVEFRLRGYAKEYAEWASANVLRKANGLGITELSGRRFVSHVTLFGSAKTDNLKQVVSKIERIRKYYLRAQPHTLIPFKIKGIDFFDRPNKTIIFLSVNPSQELEQLRWELAQNLIKVSSEYPPWDTMQTFEFHSTVGIFQSTTYVQQLRSYAETECGLSAFKQSRTDNDNPSINLNLLRITLLGNDNHIHCEYDLVLKKLLSRNEALNKYWGERTIEKLRELQATLKE